MMADAGQGLAVRIKAGLSVWAGATVCALALSAGPALAQPEGQGRAAPYSPGVKPDFSGVWRLDPKLEIVFNPAKPGTNGLPRGWMAFAGYAGMEPPPLRPAALAVARAEMEAELAGRVIDDRTAKCKPASIFDMMSWVNAVDVYQRHDELVMIVERERALPRHVYIGHTHPPLEELSPSINGHSVAHWEGDTLVIDTVGIDNQAWFLVVDFIRLSPDARVVERVRLADAGRSLLSTWTVTDPQTLTKPWSFTLTYRKDPPGTVFFDAVCDVDRRGVELGQ